jgi:hypothetical protein
MGVSALFLATGALCFLVAGYRGVFRARGRRKPTETPLMVITISSGLGLVFLAPPTQALESALLPSLGRLLSNVCALIAAFGWLHLMLYISHPAEQVPPRMRRRLIILLIAVAVLVVMFFASRRPTGLGIFAGLYRSQPTLAVYALVYTGYLGSVAVDLGILALRCVRGARAWLRLGMILIVAGCVLAIGYLAEKVIVLRELVTGSAAGPFCSSAFATPGCAFAVGMPALAVLVLILGATVPTLGPRLEHLARVLRDRRSFRQLRPLWEILHADLVSVTPDHPPGSTFRDEISERLYQRVIVIRDGLLALAPYRDPADTHRHRQHAVLAGLSDRRRAAAIEAADIRAALHRQRYDMLLPRTTPAEHHDTIQQNDLTSDLHWLTQVSDALARDELRPARGY